MITAVLIARYLVSRGRRAEAIAELADHSEPWYAPEAALEELDRLDAVDTLGTIAAADLAWHHAYPVGRALGRRRRFDLLQPLVQRPFERPEHVTPAVISALVGLWSAPAIDDDSVMIRDVLVPATTLAPHARGACAQMLALLGDTAMARAVVDELLAIEATGPARILVRLAPAPAITALGGDARPYLDEAQRVWDELFGEDVDGYGVGLQDAIDYARATVAYVPVLASKRALPWSAVLPVSRTFTSDYGRYGENRVQQEAWGHEIRHALDARDLPALLAVFEMARMTDFDHASFVLREIVEPMPRAWIDPALAMSLTTAAHQLRRGKHHEGIVAVIGALAEAGHFAEARALLAVVSPPSRSEASARLGAQLVAHDRHEAIALLTDAGDDDLAHYVLADLKAGR